MLNAPAAPINVEEALGLAETFLTATEYVLLAYRTVAVCSLEGKEIPRSGLLEAVAKADHQLAQIAEFRAALANARPSRVTDGGS
jgi:hypothetical protein